MKVRFSQDNASYELELSLDIYKKILKSIEDGDARLALDLCTQHADYEPCQKFITYELLQKGLNDKSIIEPDSSCDYDDHL